MKTRTPRIRRKVEDGEPIDVGFQITDPTLPPIDRPGPGDEHWHDENGKLRSTTEMTSGVRITAERIKEMDEMSALFERDPASFARFIARQASIAVQIGAEVMKGTFIGPSANQQRLAAAQFVVKEGKDILDTILKLQGVAGGKTSK